MHQISCLLAATVLLLSHIEIEDKMGKRKRKSVASRATFLVAIRGNKLYNNSFEWIHDKMKCQACRQQFNYTWKMKDHAKTNKHIRNLNIYNVFLPKMLQNFRENADLT